MSIQSVDRTFDIIELLSHNPQGMSLSDIADRLSLPVSTVYRLLTDLVKKAYVDKNSHLNLYKLGLKFIDLSSLYLFNLELKTEAHSILSALSRDLGFPVFLATMVDSEVCYIDRLDPEAAVQGFSIIGQKRSLFTTSLGKALLMNHNDNEILKIIQKKGMTAYTPYSISDPVKFLKELEQCRERGWSSDNQEDRLDFRCVGVPVYDSGHNIIAAVSCAWDKDYFLTVKSEDIASSVLNAVSLLTEQLGYS